MTEQGYKKYLLALLLAILASNSVDRLILGLVLQDIKVDLQLTDTQLGLLTGIAFALFYSVLGIPIARWADRGDRVTIITLTTALWSVVAMLTGLAGNFLQLLLIRIGVAVGEAGCVPTAHSLIADYFTRAERPRAVARYMLGNPVSLLMGYFLAGWINEFYGWRMTFVLLSLPGIGLAALAWYTLREPRRAKTRGTVVTASVVTVPADSVAARAASHQPSMRVVWTTLWANRTFRQLLFGFAMTYFFGLGIGKWLPTFFVRSHGLQSGELGTWFAAYGLIGAVGLYLGGELVARYAVSNERLQLRGMVIVFVLTGIINACAYVAPGHYLAFAWLSAGAVAFNIAYGPLFAIIQTLVPGSMRATAIATIFLLANLVGMGLGPLATGALSDALRPTFGEESLRYALLLLCLGYLLAAWHLWCASTTVAHDLPTAEAEDESLPVAQIKTGT